MKRLIAISMFFCLFTNTFSQIAQYFLDAIHNGNVEKVAMYLGSGISANGYYGDDRKPYILEAIETSNSDMVKLFIERGANVNSYYKVEQTKWNPTGGKYGTGGYDVINTDIIYCIVAALRKNDAKMITLLIDKGVNLDNATNEVMKNAHLPQIQYFENIGTRFKYNSTELGYAVKANKLDVVEYLISKGARGDEACILDAAENSNIEICNLLLAYGCNINMGVNGYYPLCAAVRHGNLDMVKYCVENGADLNTTCRWFYMLDYISMPISSYAVSSQRNGPKNQAVTEYLYFAPSNQQRYISENQSKALQYREEGNKFLEAGNLDKAKESFKSAFKFSHDANDLNRIVLYKVEKLRKEGENHLTTGALDKAKESFANAYALSNDNQDKIRLLVYYYDLGLKLVKEKEYNKAIEQFQNGIIKESGNHVLNLNIANCKYWLKEYDRAIVIYDSIIKIDPYGMNSAYLMRGFSYLRKNENIKALDDLNKFLSLAKDDISKSEAYCNLACYYSVCNDIDNSVSNLKKAFKLGYNKFAFLDENKDFDNVRNSKDYQKLIAKYRK